MNCWSRVRLLVAVFACLPLVLILPARASELAGGERPNILWISAEDISPDLGSYGDSYSISPNLDRLAAEGVRYVNAFSTAPVCAPSRSAIITGMYPTTIGSLHMRSKAVPPVGVKAFTEYLRAAGYYCTNNSKTDYNFEPLPTNRPPDTVWDETGNRAHWRNRGDRKQPFFAVFNLTVTHESQIRAPEAEYRKNTERLAPNQFHDPARAVLPPYYPDTPLVRRDWARYHDNITAMDYQVADILRQLTEDGLADRTIVFFWGDHGRGLPRGKRNVYDSGIRVPLIVRWPGNLQPGTVNDELVSLFDLGPTALSLAGVRIPSNMQAQAILGLQKGRPRQFAFAHRDRMDEAHDMVRSVIDRQYHYIRNFHPDRTNAQHIEYLEEMPTMKELRRLFKDHFNALGPGYGKALNAAQLAFMLPRKPVEELYDVTVDRHEVSNLASSPKHRAILLRMRAALGQWQRETRDLGSVPEAELRERMRPGGVWQKLAPPKISVIGVGAVSKVRLSIPVSGAEGASIAYTTESGERPHWLLYSGELTLDSTKVLRVKACRFGYLDSDEVVSTVSVPVR
jgi:N-sulfoglucosamine sulfohydrolase